jgi:hypothetical protein
MRYLVLAAFAAMAFSAPAVADDSEPVGQMVVLKAGQIGQIFCLSRIGNDEAVVAGILTDDLEAALTAAEQKNADYAKTYPGEKPPLGDGVPWQSSPDYARRCDVGLVTLSKSDARVEIKYGFENDPAADYVDTLILKKVPVDGMDIGYWRIDDVLYPDGTGMKDSLAAAFAGVQ